ncbi:hypothetical protein RMATCC62417_09562 [Rhizopus microsporus]|nr:hypothetical protein RMATCC62417_09562 [Rhizopus microsporus]
MWLYASSMSTRHRKLASIVLVNFATQQPATWSLAKPSKEESMAPLPAPIVNASYGKNEEAAKQEIRFPRPQLLCLALLWLYLEKLFLYLIPKSVNPTLNLTEKSLPFLDEAHSWAGRFVTIEWVDKKVITFNTED